MSPNDNLNQTSTPNSADSKTNDSTSDEKKESGYKTVVTSAKSGTSDSAVTYTKINQTAPPADNASTSQSKVSSPSAKPSEEVTIIAKGTKIVGDISADGGLRVGGDIKGNIHVVGKLELNGKVIGDIEAEDIIVCTSMVKGNVAARNMITLDKETTVVGDVSARTAELDGRIKGNMTVKQRAHMQTDSVLLGNLTSGTVNIEEGAMLRGDISITDMQGNDVKIDDLDFEIEF